jgi:hypothetical protein
MDFNEEINMQQIYKSRNQLKFYKKYYFSILKIINAKNRNYQGPGQNSVHCYKIKFGSRF